MVARSGSGRFTSLIVLAVALLALGAAAAYDEVPPAWGHAPTVTNLRPKTFDLRLSLDTTVGRCMLTPARPCLLSTLDSKT